MVKTTGEEKMGKGSDSVDFDYVNRFAYPLFSSLWKEVVEKPVENVEKCGFSTGISPYWPRGVHKENCRDFVEK